MSKLFCLTPELRVLERQMQQPLGWSSYIKKSFQLFLDRRLRYRVFIFLVTSSATAVSFPTSAHGKGTYQAAFLLMWQPIP